MERLDLVPSSRGARALLVESTTPTVDVTDIGATFTIRVRVWERAHGRGMVSLVTADRAGDIRSGVGVGFSNDETARRALAHIQEDSVNHRSALMPVAALTQLSARDLLENLE